MRVWILIVRERLYDLVFDQFGRLVQLHRLALFYNGGSLLTRCGETLLGIDSFEHPGHVLNLSIGDMTENVTLEMYHTTLPIRVRKELGH